MRAVLRLAFCALAIVSSSATAQTYASVSDSLTEYAREALSLGERSAAMKVAEAACDAGGAAGCTLRAMVDSSATQRAQFYDRGCSKGDGTACFMLQMAYGGGLGVPRDVGRARVLSEKALAVSDSACTAGDSHSCMTLGAILGMDPASSKVLNASWRQDLKGAEAAYAKGIEGIRLGCDAGTSFDCFALAVALINGTGIAKDHAGGAALLQASCDGGFADACSTLGVSLSTGMGGMPKDEARSKALLERACDGGQWGACQLLGFAQPTKDAVSAAFEQRRGAKAAQPATAATGEPPKKKPFKVLRSVAGAAATYFAAKAVGASPDEALGAAAKATEMINPGNEFAQRIGKMGDDMIVRSLEARLANATANAGDPAPAASAPAGASSTKGKGMKKPLFAGLASACAPMTAANYRTAALSPGGDVQLKSMCGQAYEYYRMYERAVDQGYAPADYNRTYAAHAGSARVAIDYSKRR